MSFDVDWIPTDADELNTLFASLSNKRSPVRSSKDKAGYFASSMFQNSPSPDELPPPTFRPRA